MILIIFFYLLKNNLENFILNSAQGAVKGSKEEDYNTSRSGRLQKKKNLD